MSSILQLNIVSANGQVTANLSWSGQIPQGTIDYLIFYRATNVQRIKSISTTSLSAVISQLTNDTTYVFQATAFQGGYHNGTVLSETAAVAPATVPDAPASLQAIVRTNGNIISGEVQLHIKCINQVTILLSI